MYSERDTIPILMTSDLFQTHRVAESVALAASTKLCKNKWYLLLILRKCFRGEGFGDWENKFSNQEEPASLLGYYSLIFQAFILRPCEKIVSLKDIEYLKQVF